MPHIERIEKRKRGFFGMAASLLVAGLGVFSLLL